MPDIKAVAVIGAGVMGRGIAHLAVLGGYHVILEDIVPSSLRRAEEEFRNILDQAIAAGEISRGDAEAALERLEFAQSVDEAARRADLVIEAVPDEWESKSEIFILLDKICRPETILVTATLTLSVSDIASVTYRPEKVVGIKFEEPVHRMERIEIVQGRHTEADTVAACMELVGRMGKQAIEIGASAYRDIGLSKKQ